MLTIYQLMKYLRKHHSVAVKSNQAQALRNIGYYHGYKGYRFIRQPRQRISFTSLDEVIALNSFDMQLKTLFYPKVMFIENALKSYVIESVLLDSKSENLDVIFNRSITNFESLTLGEFGTFFSCANSNVKLNTSHILHLPSNLDSDGKLTEYIIYTIKDLRNAVAHNNAIFDTRFQTSRINQRLISLLEVETGISNLDFKYIDAYVVLITYTLRKMGETKTSCKQFISSFITCTDALRSQLSANVCNQILGTQQRSHLKALQNFLSKS